MCERVDCSAPVRSWSCGVVSGRDESARMIMSLLGVILMGNDWRAAQAARRLNVGGRVSSSGVKFS